MQDMEPFDLGTELCGCDSPIDVGGWWQNGYYTRNSSQLDGSLGYGSFNNHLDERYRAQQIWFYSESVADGSEGFDAGYRVDFMYGQDANDTQSFGNNPGRWDFQNGWDRGNYGFALPQLYGEVAYGDLSVKVGHFFTLVGYEVVTAPDNFFFSHSFTMYNSEPFTHTGAIATYQAVDNLTVYGGWTAGWDTGFDRNSDGDASKGSNFLGGFSYQLTDDMTFTYINTVGDFGVRGEGYSHSIVLDTQVTDKLKYVFQSDYVNTNTRGDYQVGVNQYLFYDISDKLATGIRAEWWKTGTVPETVGMTGNASFYEMTYGVNWKPTANMTVRPEVRYQWSPFVNRNAAAAPLQPFFPKAIFGVDAIWTF